MANLTIREIDRRTVRALDGTRKLEDHWRLELEDSAKLESFEAFSPQATDEGKLAFLVMSTDEVPVLRDDILGAIAAHMGADDTRSLELTEDQALYVLEHCQGDLPRNLDTEIFMRRGASAFVGVIVWVAPLGGGEKAFELWIGESSLYGLDDEHPEGMWIVRDTR